MKLDPPINGWAIRGYHRRWVTAEQMARHMAKVHPPDLCLVHAPTAHAHVLNNTLRADRPAHPQPLVLPPPRRTPLFDGLEPAAKGAYRHLLDEPAGDRA